MSLLKFIIFGFLFCIFSYGQQDKYDIKYLSLIECVDQAPGQYVYIGRSNLSYFHREFFKQNNEFVAGDWELNGSLYNSADDANNDSNPYIYDIESRSYLVPYNNPLIIYLRLNQVTMPPRQDNKHYVVKSVTNYLKYPPVFNTTLDGCEIDENNQKYNLNEDYLIKEFRSILGNPYNFEIFRKTTDVSPIPESEWSNFILRKGESNKLYVKVTYKDGTIPCFRFYEMTLKLVDYSISMENTEYEFCGTPFLVEGPNDSNLSNFEWTHNGIVKSTNKNITIDEIGKWIVSFENNLGCRSSVTVNVIPEKIWNRIEKITATSTSVIIHPYPNASIVGYSLDGINFQSSNRFDNQTDPIFTFYYKTKLGCIFGPFTMDVATNFNFFTPNGDGINDKWDLRGKEFYKNYVLQIFNRSGKSLVYGKVIDVLPWNGKVNNLTLPSDTYWYLITDGDKTIKTGYIILKNK